MIEVKAGFQAAKGSKSFLSGAKAFSKAVGKSAARNADDIGRSLARVYRYGDDGLRNLLKGVDNLVLDPKNTLVRWGDDAYRAVSSYSDDLFRRFPSLAKLQDEFALAGVSVSDDFARQGAKVYNLSDNVAGRVSQEFSEAGFRYSDDVARGSSRQTSKVSDNFADDVADVIVRKGDDVPRLKEVEVEFNRNPKHDKAEFTRQLADQEAGMNQLTVQEYLDNRERYIAEGRALEGNAAQQAAREKALGDKTRELILSGKSPDIAEIEAKTWLDTQAALHNPDQIAGGYADRIGGMGDSGINSSIGAQWQYRIDAVDEQILEMASKLSPEQLNSTYLNVKLTH